VYKHGRREIPLREHPCDFLHVPTNCLSAGTVVGAVGFHLNRALVRRKVKMVVGHSVTEAHALVTSLVHLGFALRVSGGRDRRGRLSHDAQSKQGEGQRAGENLVHAYRATGLPSANQGAASSRDPVFRKGRLSGILGSHPAPAEKGLGVPSPCLEVLPGLQSPCECGLSDRETRGSFP
jgi:hypothetical protein